MDKLSNHLAELQDFYRDLPEGRYREKFKKIVISFGLINKEITKKDIKIKMCNYLLDEKPCLYKEKCKWAHSKHELANYKHLVCKKWLNDNCYLDESLCSFSHSDNPREKPRSITEEQYPENERKKHLTSNQHRLTDNPREKTRSFSTKQYRENEREKYLIPSQTEMTDYDREKYLIPSQNRLTDNPTEKTEQYQENDREKYLIPSQPTLLDNLYTILNSSNNRHVIPPPVYNINQQNLN